MPHTVHQGTVDADMQQCVEECLRCQQVCTTTVSYCLTKGGRPPTPNISSRCSIARRSAAPVPVSCSVARTRTRARVPCAPRSAARAPSPASAWVMMRSWWRARRNAVAAPNHATVWLERMPLTLEDVNQHHLGRLASVAIGEMLGRRFAAGG